MRVLQTSPNDNWGLRGKVLEAAILEDMTKGRVPFMLIANLGATSFGAIDNMAEIIQVAKKYSTLHVHVDAAWGGPFMACPELREQAGLDFINQGADSFCTNLHKTGVYFIHPILILIISSSLN